MQLFYKRVFNHYTLKPDPQITQENIEEAFTVVYGDKETHLRRFFLNQRKENKLYTFWVIQAFLEIENENEQAGVWIPLKEIKKLLVPNFIRNGTSLFRLLDKMVTSHLIDKKTEITSYDKSLPDKKKEDSFYRLCTISFLGFMDKDQEKEVDRLLYEQTTRFWEKIFELQKQNSELSKMILDLHLKLRAAKTILHDLGVSDPDQKIDECLQTEQES